MQSSRTRSDSDKEKSIRAYLLSRSNEVRSKHMTIEQYDARGWEFRSPTLGRVSFREMADGLVAEAKRDAANPLRICVGSDSEEVADGVKFVAVVLVWRVGRGARAYYYTETDNTISMRDRKGSARFRDRIFREVMMTATLAAELRALMIHEFSGALPHDVEVHADVGENGQSSVMIKEVTGLLRGYGFAEDAIFIKPHAFAAQTVADRVI